MTTADRTPDADRCRQLLDDPHLTGALDGLEHQYLTAALECAPTDDLGRFRYLEAAKVTRQVRQHLRAQLAEGRAQVTHLNRARSWV